MGRTRARRRARPVSPPQFGLRFTDIFLDNERFQGNKYSSALPQRPQLIFAAKYAVLGAGT